MEKQLEQILLRALPDLTHPVVTGIERFTSGWESEVYAFQVEHGPDENRASTDLILRIYPGEPTAGAIQKAEGEYRTLSILGQVGYPVPRLFTLQTTDSPFKRPFIIMERIHGYNLWPIIFHNPDPAIREYCLHLFCRLFVDLHALPWRDFVPAEYQFEPSAPTDMLDRQFNIIRPFIESVPVPGFLPVLDWLEAHKSEAGGMRVSLIHYDFHPENVLLCPDGKAFVIDWTGAALSDYRCDLAWTLALVLAYEGPEWRETILREYERQAGSAVENLAYFDVLACVRRLYSIAAAIKYGAEKLGMRPGAEETIRSQIEPTRRVYELLQARCGLRIPEIESILGA
jgi:aminoglycoside phosphotransferase (APT) family kinase protein